MPTTNFMALISLLVTVAIGLSPDALALQAEEIFRTASPSITMVFAEELKNTIQGSGVVVGPERVITNCHVVLSKTGSVRKQLRVKFQGQLFQAKYLTGDPQYDTCLLRVSGLSANPVVIANLNLLRVGQRVYAIGAPSGLDLTLTDGLISSLRTIDRTQVVQTSAPISPGSSGGGLFSDNGELIGITSFTIGTGRGLNFAYLADHVISLVALANRMKDSTDNGPSNENFKEDPRVAVTDSAAPPSPDEKLNWLTEMSQRLDRRMPDRTARQEFLMTVYYEAKRAGVDPQLVLALIQTLSGFHKYAVSREGARGFMQVMPFWVELIGQKNNNLFHLRTNLRYGCTILRHYLDIEHGNLFRALGRYNGTVGQPEFPNTVRKVWANEWNWRPRAIQ